MTVVMKTIFDTSEFVLPMSFVLQKEQYQYPTPQADNGRGQVTDLTSADLHEKSEIYVQNVEQVSWGVLFPESFIFLRKIACHWERVANS